LYVSNFVVKSSTSWFLSVLRIIPNIVMIGRTLCYLHVQTSSPYHYDNFASFFFSDVESRRATFNCNDSKTATTDGDGVKTELETENSEVSSNFRYNQLFSGGLCW